MQEPFSFWTLLLLGKKIFPRTPTRLPFAYHWPKVDLLRVNMWPGPINGKAEWDFSTISKQRKTSFTTTTNSPALLITPSSLNHPFTWPLISSYTILTSLLVSFNLMDLNIIYMLINSKVFNRHLKPNMSQIELLILSSKPVPPEIFPISVNLWVTLDSSLSFIPLIQLINKSRIYNLATSVTTLVGATTISHLD